MNKQQFSVDRKIVIWERVEVEAVSLDEALELALAKFADGEGLDLGVMDATGDFWVEDDDGGEWTFTNFELVEEEK